MVADVDQAVKKLSTNRFVFTRDALRAFLDQLNKAQLEKKHQQGYERHPINQSNFNDWHDEQVVGYVPSILIIFRRLLKEKSALLLQSFILIKIVK